MKVGRDTELKDSEGVVRKCQNIEGKGTFSYRQV